MKARLVRPWILFPYKSLKTQIALTLKLLLLWLSNCRKLLIWGCASMWCKLFILFMFVYDKNKDTPFCIGSITKFLCYSGILLLQGWYVLQVITCRSLIKVIFLTMYLEWHLEAVRSNCFDQNSDNKQSSRVKLTWCRNSSKWSKRWSIISKELFSLWLSE